jgi:hypothetical protein
MLENNKINHTTQEKWIFELSSSSSEKQNKKLKMNDLNKNASEMP